MKKLKWNLVERTLQEKGLEFFNAFDIKRIFGVSLRSAQAFLSYHTKLGSVKKLRKNLYVFSSRFPDKFKIANRLYEPSYISLETALSFYSIIPEVVYSITSVTSRKTAVFTIDDMEFLYRKVKLKTFTGYYLHKKGFLIAYPEKALVDYLYFLVRNNLLVNERLNVSNLNLGKVKEYVALFDDKKLFEICKKLFRL